MTHNNHTTYGTIVSTDNIDEISLTEINDSSLSCYDWYSDKLRVGYKSCVSLCIDSAKEKFATLTPQDNKILVLVETIVDDDELEMISRKIIAQKGE